MFYEVILQIARFVFTLIIIFFFLDTKPKETTNQVILNMKNRFVTNSLHIVSNFSAIYIK